MCGEDTHKPNIHNPEGFYEERAFGQLFKIFVGEESIKVDEWEYRLQEMINKRHVAHKKWGLKSNLLAYFFPMLLDRLPEQPKIILCHRELYATARSWAITFDEPLRDCIIEIDTRVRLLDRWLKNKEHMRIDFTERLGEEALLREIQRYLGRK
jgi:hypothetical protein